MNIKCTMLFCCYFVSGLYPENPQNRVYHIIILRARGEGILEKYGFYQVIVYFGPINYIRLCVMTVVKYNINREFL